MSEPKASTRAERAGWVDALRARRPRRRAAVALRRSSTAGISTRPISSRLREPPQDGAGAVRARRGQDRRAGRGRAHRALRAGARAEGRRVLRVLRLGEPAADRTAIREKLALDGVEIDGIVFKDQLQHLVRGPLPFLREQVGFKLAELLKARLAAPPGAIEYPLRRRLGVAIRSSTRSTPTSSSGRSTTRALGDILVAPRASTRRAWSRSARSPRACRPGTPCAGSSSTSSGGLRRAASAPSERGSCPTFNYFQTALVLTRRAWCRSPRWSAVGALADRRARPTRAAQLRNSLDDLVRRGLSAADDAALRRDLEEAGVLPSTIAQGTLDAALVAASAGAGVRRRSAVARRRRA